MQLLQITEEPAEQQRTVTAQPLPHIEDARRRFILALRAMTLRREQYEARQRKQRENEEAEAALVRKLTADLESDIRAYRKWRLRRRIRRIVLLSALAAFIFWRHELGGFWWLWFVFGGSAAADATAKRREKSIQALTGTRNPRAISVLAVAARHGDSATRSVAVTGLKRVLPYAQASDREHVSAKGIAALIGMLRSFDWELVLAILKALEQIGDARAIPEVKRLAQSFVPHSDVSSFFRLQWKEWIRFSNSVAWERIREEAQHCLEALEARAELDRQRNLLLRPAENPQGPESILLRPAAGASPTPVEQLLRPVRGEE